MIPGSLLVILPDRISDWAAKGEITDRYLNPGVSFGRVDILLTNDDRPDPAVIDRLVGGVPAAVHNLPANPSLFVTTLGWRPRLLRWWAARAVDLAERLEPRLVRCHGVRPNALAASEIKRRLGIPYVVSVHANHDTELRGERATPARRLAAHLAVGLERVALRHADLVLPVYEPIVPYIERLGVTHYEVAYNVVALGSVPKQDWGLRDGVLRTICVGRQQPRFKDPTPLVDAVATTSGTHLLLVGDGPLHDGLVARVQALGVGDRVQLVRSLPNEEVIRRLRESDAFVYCTQMYELSKGCMEAALVGLPIVIEDRVGGVAPELRGDHVEVVDGTAAGWAAALRRLRDDEGERRRLGQAALAHAGARWHPVAAERRIVEIYRGVTGSHA